jgi:hypothetical protein
MIAGNPSVFAIESSINCAYERPSLLGLGFFVIYVGGRCYGVRAQENTMLACSYDEISSRISMRGQHVVPFATEPDGGKIADAFRTAIYSDDADESYFNLPLLSFTDLIHSKCLAWAPDGDEAFDDGSFVLHFDVNESVRLIAFKSGPGYIHEPASLSDVWLSADDFYGILDHWRDAFDGEWKSMPKLP